MPNRPMLSIAAVATLALAAARPAQADEVVRIACIDPASPSWKPWVMGHGEIVFEGTPASLAGNAQVRREWLEV